jgi:hypothetical protein
MELNQTEKLCTSKEIVTRLKKTPPIEWDKIFPTIYPIRD